MAPMAKQKRHAPVTDRRAEMVAELRRTVLESAGVCAATVRAAAASGEPLPPPLQDYATKVRDSAWRITDADIAALSAAGYSQDEIFEVTVAAALGAGLRSLQAGLDLMGGTDSDAAGDP
jgi:hypothetical protein